MNRFRIFLAVIVILISTPMIVVAAGCFHNGLWGSGLISFFIAGYGISVGAVEIAKNVLGEYDEP